MRETFDSAREKSEVKQKNSRTVRRTQNVTVFQWISGKCETFLKKFLFARSKPLHKVSLPLPLARSLRFCIPRKLCFGEKCEECWNGCSATKLAKRFSIFRVMSWRRKKDLNYDGVHWLRIAGGNRYVCRVRRAIKQFYDTIGSYISTLVLLSPLSSTDGASR